MREGREKSRQKQSKLVKSKIKKKNISHSGKVVEAKVRGRKDPN